MKDLLKALPIIEDWVNAVDGRAVIISAVGSISFAPTTLKPNPDNFLYIKGKKADVNAGLAHLVQTFK